MNKKPDTFRQRVLRALVLIAVEVPLTCLVCCCLACVTCSFPPRWNPCGTGRMQEARNKTRKKELRGDIPLPLREKAERKRRLTLLLEAKTAKNTQQRSRLLALPLEVRMMIWRYAVGGRVFTLTPGAQRQRRAGWREKRAWKKRGGYGSVIKRLAFEDSTDLDTSRFRMFHGACMDFVAHGGREIQHRPLALLLTCRQIYLDAISMFYSENTFRFKSPQTLMDFPTTIPSCRARLITSVRLDTEVELFRELMPQYSFTEATRMLQPPPLAEDKSPSSGAHSWTPFSTLKQKPAKQWDHPLTNLRSVTIHLSFSGGLGLNNELELQRWGWDVVCAPVVTLAEAMADNGGEVELRTAWEEFEWEKEKWGHVRGLRIVRPEGA